MKYKILLISVFGRIDDNTNDRVNNIHDYFKSYTKIVTTDFSHRYKIHHSKKSSRNVDYIHVPSYKNNLSLKRLCSHWVFAIKLIAYLHRYGMGYDVWFCLVPTPSSALAIWFYKIITRSNVPLFIDVIDVWPQALISKTSSLISILLWPWKMMSYFVYLKSNRVYAATKKYRNIIGKINFNTSETFYPLGVDINQSVKLRESSTYVVNKKDNEIWVAYAGNFGFSYDFDQMIYSMKEVQNKLKPTIKFILIGGGVQESIILRKLNKSKIKYTHTGILSYKDYLKCLSFCDIGFNIYKSKSVVAQSYKFNDYVDSGLFIFNNLTGETAELIDDYDIGRNIQSVSELTVVLIETIANWDKIKNGIKNKCQTLINEKLDKNKIYESMEQDVLSSLNSI